MVHWRGKSQPTPVFLPGEPHEQYEKAKDRTSEDEHSRSEGVTYAIREERKAITRNQYADHSLSNSMKLSHAMWVHPRQTGHGGEVCQNMVNRTR